MPLRISVRSRRQLRRQTHHLALGPGNRRERPIIQTSQIHPRLRRIPTHVGPGLSAGEGQLLPGLRHHVGVGQRRVRVLRLRRVASPHAGGPAGGEGAVGPARHLVEVDVGAGDVGVCAGADEVDGTATGSVSRVGVE